MAEEFPVPEIETFDDQHLAVVRATVSMSDIPALYDRAYPLIFGALARAGVVPRSAPMGVTHGAPGPTLDLSVAVPVEAPFSDSGEVVAETIPAGKAATLLVAGDYSRLSAAYAHLFGWIAEQGLTPGRIAWEQYLTEPEPGGDPELNLTRVAVQLA